MANRKLRFQVRYPNEAEWVDVTAIHPSYGFRLPNEAAERFVDEDFGANTDYFKEDNGRMSDCREVIVREVLEHGFGPEEKYLVEIDYYPTFIAHKVED